MILSRRKFFMLAAPAIVLAPSLMKISTAILLPTQWDIEAMAALAERQIVSGMNRYILARRPGVSAALIASPETRNLTDYHQYRGIPQGIVREIPWR